MKIWTTEIKALDATTGEMKTWCGEMVHALTERMAQEWCRNNKGYLQVTGELISEIPCKEGTYEPDFKNKIDYDNIQNN